ncbi:T9SS type A sorting domain-containing protein [Formosa sediminum]|uniref:T9SS type A sorting domain-containing protein n=1 Tax=Formosa sediminum TaxID=2594004 RepID=A0A516GPT6_9FLAO|nr:T9SS type A sorting domain-containing protein [Formosa sediminum]QDO93519.1 T9SS type A sorting domain-containing protein [Formosa sediminum]
MGKNYLFTFLTCFLFFVVSHTTHAQSIEANISQNIEELSIYPNPVMNGKLYIVTKENLTKDIEIFNVLGKLIFQTTLFGKEVNISKLNPGIYIIKIKENNISTTRKLVVR